MTLNSMTNLAYIWKSQDHRMVINAVVGRLQETEQLELPQSRDGCLLSQATQWQRWAACERRGEWGARNMGTADINSANRKLRKGRGKSTSVGARRWERSRPRGPPNAEAEVEP